MRHGSHRRQRAGVSIRSWGDTSRIVERWEGLFLVRRLPRLNQDVLMQAPTAMRLWAKRDPFQPLPCHLVDTGFVALELLNTTAFGMVRGASPKSPAVRRMRWTAGSEYLVASARLGKCWRNFQPGVLMRSLRHLLHRGFG